MTETVVAALSMQFAPWGAKRTVAAIHYSIAQGWRSVHEASDGCDCTLPLKTKEDLDAEHRRRQEETRRKAEEDKAAADPSAARRVWEQAKKDGRV